MSVFEFIMNAEVKAFGHGHYLIIPDGPLVHTDLLRFHVKPNIFQGTITFKVPKSLSEKLYSEIVAMENRAANTLRQLTDVQLNQLPEKISTQIRTRRNDPNWQCLRPNYFSQGEQMSDPTFYLKGNIYGISVFDFAGNYLPVQYLNEGMYQFVIRANMIYIGEHKNDYHVGNLQLRITQVRYTPGSLLQAEQELMEAVDLDAAEASSVDVLVDKIMNDKENPVTPANSPSAVPPTPQKKAPRKKKVLPNETPKRPVLQRQNAIVNLENYLKEQNTEAQ